MSKVVRLQAVKCFYILHQKPVTSRVLSIYSSDKNIRSLVRCRFSRYLEILKFYWVFFYQFNMSLKMLIIIQLIRKCKLLFTIFAYKWLFSCMGLNMILQMTRLRKRFFTIFTFKWFFSRMGSNMFFQMTRLQKRFFYNIHIQMVFLPYGFEYDSSNY